MKKTNIGLLVFAGLFVLFVQMFSLLISYRFGASFGKTVTDQAIMGGIAASMDGFKMMLPIIAAIAALYKLKWLSGLSWVFWVPLAVFAVFQTYGYFITNRTDTGEVRRETASIASDTRDEIKHLKTKRGKAAVLEKRYADRCTSRKRRKWKSCRAMKQRLANLGSSKEIDVQLRAYRSERKRSVVSVRAEKDPQLVALKQLSGLDFFAIISSIAFAFGIGMELVGALGGVFVWKPLFKALKAVVKGGSVPTTSVVDELDGGKIVDPPGRMAPVTELEADGLSVDHHAEEWGGSGGPTSFIGRLLSATDRVEEETRSKIRVWPAVSSTAPRGDSVQGFFMMSIQPGAGALSGVEIHNAYQVWCGETGAPPLLFMDFHEQFSRLVQTKLPGVTVTRDPRGRRFADKIRYDSISLKSSHGNFDAAHQALEGADIEAGAGVDENNIKVGV